jgi:hypothetical protein
MHEKTELQYAVKLSIDSLDLIPLRDLLLGRLDDTSHVKCEDAV